jgi:hypothetical protein
MRDYHPNGSLPKDNEILVFGSNTRGWHGKGAALLAKLYYGAVQYKPKGLMGQSYAIATKGVNEETRRLYSLPIARIVIDILLFCEFTKKNTDMRFFVTAVGCGLAGYGDDEIAPYFKGAINCSFPEEWEVYLED